MPTIEMSDNESGKLQKLLDMNSKQLDTLTMLSSGEYFLINKTFLVRVAATALGVVLVISGAFSYTYFDIQDRVDRSVQDQIDSSDLPAVQQGLNEQLQEAKNATTLIERHKVDAEWTSVRLRNLLNEFESGSLTLRNLQIENDLIAGRVTANQVIVMSDEGEDVARLEPNTDGGGALTLFNPRIIDFEPCIILSARNRHGGWFELLNKNAQPVIRIYGSTAANGDPIISILEDESRENPWNNILD